MTGESANYDFIAGFHQGTFPAVLNLYREHYDILYDFAVQLIRDEQESRDIVVETFIKLLHMRAEFDSEANIKAFLYITVRNNCFAFLRYTRPGNAQPRVFEYPVAEPAAEKITDSEETLTALTRAIYQEIDNLPDDCRGVFHLSFHKRLDTETIARQLGILPGEVLSRRTRAVHLLQKALLQKGMLSTPVLIYFLAVVYNEKNARSGLPSKG